jgi:hypothetical protein
VKLAGHLKYGVGSPNVTRQSRVSQRKSALDESIAAYATRHGGGADRVDLDPELEAASVEHRLEADKGNGR